MTTAFKQRSLGGKAARASALCLLALAATLLQAREARAQWTTPDAAGNINSTNTGNVGVGTAAPASKLDILGNTGVTVRAGGASAGFNIFDRPAVAGDQLVFQGNAGNYSVINTATRNANFGSEKLSGLAMWTVDNVYTPNATQFQLQNSPAYGGVIFTQKFGTGAQGDKKVSFQTAWNQMSVPTQFVLDTNGNIGIGASAPGSKLVISANAAAPLAPNPANPSVLAPQDGTILHIVNADTQKTRVTIDSFGNSAGPSVSFRAGRGTLAAPAATLSGDALGIVYGGGFGVSRFHSGAKPAMWMVASENWTDTAAGSAIFFNTVKNGSTATVERMRISDAGNVGIGTPAPATALHVIGDVTVSGNISAKYQDVAEWVPSTQALAAGTVVALDTTRANHVVASASAYDTRVAGVVSAQPGLILGEGGEGKVMVATTGRVKVKVDATRAPIQIGDLIVTSGASGVAMRSEPVSVGGVQMHRPGTLIGKALESLEKGTGEILVLLSLQ